MIGRRLCNLRLFCLIFFSLALGIAFSVNLIAGAIFFFAILIVLIITLNRTHKVAVIAIVAISYFVGFFYASGLNYAFNTRDVYKDEGYITGTVTIDTSHDESGTCGDVVIVRDVYYNDIHLDNSAKIYVSSSANIKVGDRIRVRGTLDNNRLIIDDIGTTSDYIDDIGYFVDAREIDSIEHAKMRWRDRVVLDVHNALLRSTDRDTAGFLLAMLLGDKSGLTGSVKLSASRLGTAHLFAVSGLHIGMIATFLVWILTKCRVDKRYHLFIVPILIFYAYLCDFSVSVLRATIMVSIYLFSKALFMRYDMLSSISFAGSVLLLICPMYLFDLSFIMSFLAVISIALFGEMITKWLCRKSTRHRTLKSALATNLAVNIGMLPIMLYAFSGVSLLVVPANLVIIPLVSLIFPIAMVLIPILTLCQAHILIGIVAMPFRGIVLLSKALTPVNFVALSFDVNWIFVLTYIILMFYTSEYVFVSDRAKRAPRIVLLLIIVTSLVMPPILKGIWGDRLTVTKGYKSYTVALEDTIGEDVLVVMGEPNQANLEFALRSYSKGETVSTMVVPRISKSEIALVSYYAQSFGVERIVTASDIAIDGIEIASAHDGVEILPSGNVSIVKDEMIILLDNVGGKRVENEYIDILISMDKGLNVESITPKYYINFSKVSPREPNSDFTFYIKNGKITNERMAKTLLGGE